MFWEVVRLTDIRKLSLSQAAVVIECRVMDVKSAGH